MAFKTYFVFPYQEDTTCSMLKLINLLFDYLP